MKSNKFFRNSAIVTALLASLCCITPVLAILGGLSGIASTFSFLDPLRPFLIALTAIVLSYAFYNTYKPKKETDIECACDDDKVSTKKKFINSKTFLWVVTLAAVVLMAFPYYSQVLFPEIKNTTAIDSSNITKVKLEIEGMTCTGCEQSVDYALKSEDGVISAESSYKTGIAYVQFDDTKVQSQQLKKAIEEKVGYKVKKIQTIPEGTSNEKEN